MGREIVYCSQCGVRILEKDLAAGRAFTVLNKVFCADCRDQAFSQAPQLGSGRGPAPAPKAPAAPPAAERKATVTVPRAAIQGIRPPARPEGVQAPRAVLRRKNNTPLYIGSAVGVVAMVVLIVVIMSSGGGKTPAKGGGGGGSSPESLASLTPEERAAKKLNELHAFAAAAKDPKDVLKKAQEFEKDIVSTPSEEGFRAFRKKWQRKIAEAEAGKKIDAMIAQSKSITKGDPEFKRSGEAMEILQKAEELALADAIDKVVDVKAARKELEEPYEAAAQDWFEGKDGKKGNEDKIRMWMRESEYKGALSILATFPENLKLSKAWLNKGSRLVEECEKGKAAQAAKAAGKEVEKDWKNYLRLASGDHQLKNYAKAKENYLKAEAALPPAEKLIDQERRTVAWALFYNLGCLYAEESKKLEGAEKTKAVDAAFDFLRKAGERGVFEYHCGCGDRDHKSGRDHWDKDKDLETIRSDPRYAEIIQKYVK
jgi:tetratricopeptide (TPR) repeat protein